MIERAAIAVVVGLVWGASLASALAPVQPVACAAQAEAEQSAELARIGGDERMVWYLAERAAEEGQRCAP